MSTYVLKFNSFLDGQHPVLFSQHKKMNELSRITVQDVVDAIPSVKGFSKPCSDSYQQVIRELSPPVSMWASRRKYFDV